jgi:cell division protein FtsI (penicillin-binding protein 3)
MRVIERRIGLIFALFLLGLSIATVKALWLGVVRADALKKAAATQQKATLTVPARRGSIVDRNGEELAVSQPALSVAATPYLIRDPLKVSEQIAPMLGLDQDKVLEALSKKGTGFVWLARKLPVDVVRKVQDLKIEGLDFVEEATRVYPRKFVASQLLGFTGTDNTGLAGLELQHDKQLRGRDGKRLLVKDALGQAIRLKDEHAAIPGKPLTLTLDDRIQEETENVLAEVGAKYKPAKGATAIVMDPRNGELLAVANWPRIDANNIDGAPDWAKQDRAVQVSYEPGSTFKAFTFAGALTEKKVTPDEVFQLPAFIQVADRQIGEAHGVSYGTLTASDILRKSSNVGTITIGLRLGADHFDKWVRAFGFGKVTGVDLPGEQTGIVLPRDKYSGSSMGNLPIGQGEAVTPMQMATAYAAIANGGVLRPPRVVKAIGGRQTPVPKGKRVISTGVAAELRDMLEGVLGPGGTASGAAIPGYQLAGKTGTAEKPDPVNGGYSKTRFVASFVGFAPAKNPRLLTLVMVDEPQGDIYGGSVAAPAWRDITAFALNYLRIPPK